MPGNKMRKKIKGPFQNVSKIIEILKGENSNTWQIL
jgi:hypothetical protein